MIDIRLHVIIRPRGREIFCTHLLNWRLWKKIFGAARQAGADGVVFGCLTPEGELDKPAMQRLMEASKGLSVTFHRAFDYVKSPREALEELIGMGVNRVLTSGQMPTAMEGAPLLAELVKQAGDRIIIMPGCGVNEHNIAELARVTGAGEFHFSAREQKKAGCFFAIRLCRWRYGYG